MSAKSQRRRKSLHVAIGAATGVLAALLVSGLSLEPKKTITAQPQVNVVQTPQKIDWVILAQDVLKKEDASLIQVAFKAGVLTLGGDVPKAGDRLRAMNLVKQAVIKQESHIGKVLAFDNQITVAGNRLDDAPDAASTLGPSPSPLACQTAYDTLLDGRVINFGSGSAVLSEESKPLLNALADVAKRCETYLVELGGHTDARGDATANQALSERRAQSVADYLVSRSVPASLLGVNGYGETRPKDSRGGAKAEAKNRRIEFKVIEAARP
jgi:outer membrane protein OmpA-like peptidoglycan-associated protein